MDHDAFSKDAWTRARNRFVEDLTSDERRLYYQATPELILYDASAAEKRHQSSSSSRNILEKLRPFVEAIDQYGGAMDVYANTYPLVMSPLWGSIRVILHVKALGNLLTRSNVVTDPFSSLVKVVSTLNE